MADATKNTVLVIEDDPDTLDLLINALREEGVDVSLAGRGETGLHSTAQERPDLILSIFDLSDMEGLEFLRQVGGIPVIFTATNRSREQIATAVSQGAVDFIGKPFLLREVVARVLRHLQIINREQALLEEIARLKAA